jgi:hypothetical protein
MSPALARVRGAAVTTFAVYVCGALLALLPAVPLASALERAVADHPAGSSALYEPGGNWLMEAVASAGAAWSAIGKVTLVAMALSLLLGPLLQMAWLAALLRRRRLADSLAEGARRYFAAIGLSLALAPLLALAGLALVAMPSVVALAVKNTPSDRTHDLALLAACVPALLLAAVWATWHDLARASLARGGGVLSAVLRGGIATFERSAMPAYLAWLALGSALGLATYALGGALDVGGALASATVLLVTQLLSLTRTFVRARWLAAALDRVR